MTTRSEPGLRFELSDGVPLPDLTDVVPGATAVTRAPVRLVAAYFDTGSLALLANDVSLRWQDGGPAAPGWTLEFPEAYVPGGRRWGERSWTGGRAEVPAEAERLLTGLTRGRPLRCVAWLRCDRQQVDVYHESGGRLAGLRDDVVAAEGRPAGGFRAVEVELDGGNGAVSGRIGKALRRAGARRGPEGPLLARVLGPVPRPAAGAARLGRSSSILAVVRDSMLATLSSLERHDLALRAGDDVEAVHKARVAARRARADLGTLRPLLDPAWVDEARAELRWFGGLLGDVRDADVLAGRLDRNAGLAADGGDTAGVAALRSRLANQRRVALSALRAGLDDPRYFVLLGRLEDAASWPPWRVGRLDAWVVAPTAPAGPILARLVRRRCKKLRRAVEALPAAPTAAQLHRVRIAAKRLRYAAELARPGAGRPAKRLARAAKSLQEALGSHHDAWEAETWLRAVPAGGASPGGGFTAASAPEAFAAGLAVPAERAAQDEAAAAWPASWTALRRVCRRRWLAPR